MSDQRDNTHSVSHIGYYGLNPSFDINCQWPEPDSGNGVWQQQYANPVYLTGVRDEEVDVIVKVLRRMGAKSITVARHNPFVQTISSSITQP
jgi:hypothetical protein